MMKDVGCVENERVVNHDISAGRPRTLKHGTETLEATRTQLQIMDPKRRRSINMRLVARRWWKWTSMEE